MAHDEMKSKITPIRDIDVRDLSVDDDILCDIMRKAGIATPYPLA
jgi:hypothetical protein